MSKKIVIIDGHSILNRAFYGIPILTNSEGVYTNAIYGFLNTMFQVIDEEKPEYLVVAFDVHAPTFRHEIYEEYKGTRKPMPEELRPQIPIAKEVLQAMGIHIVEKAGYEADDVIGTIARICKEDGFEVTILSGDRDNLQLATDKVKIRIPKTSKGRTEVETYYDKDVKERYGITPTEFIDMKALMGDSSDNIPGVPGIGEKTAQKIIQDYGSIENAHAHVEELKPPRASKNLEEFWEQAKLSKVLATIETHGDISFDLETAKYENPYTQEAYDFFQELEFKNFLSRFDASPRENQVEDVFIEIQSKEELQKVIDSIEKTGKVGFAMNEEYISLAYGKEKVVFIKLGLPSEDAVEKDIEEGIEESTEKMTGESIEGSINVASDSNDLTNEGFAKDGSYDVYEEMSLFDFMDGGSDEKSEENNENIPLALRTGTNEVVFNAKEKEPELLIEDDDQAGAKRENRYDDKKNILSKISQLIDSRDEFTLAAFDIKQHLKSLPSRKISHYFDGTIAAYLLNPNKNDYQYSDVAKEHLNLIVDEKAEGYKQICYAAYTAFASVEVLKEKLESAKMWSLFEEIEMPLLFTLFKMEQRGIKIEAQELAQYSEMLGKQIIKLEQEIYQEAGEEFNINSPKQLGVVLFEHLGLPYGKKTKTGFSTAADVLEKLALDYPIVSKILEYRQLSKLKSTYADGLANYIEADGRIHGKFNQTITATGRLSSTEPNLQNIPIRMELGQLIRKVFIPEPEFVFVDADYSQIELRIMAHLSGDEQLIQAYKVADDIHTSTAAQVFHIPFDQVTEEQRRNAKAVNFGIIYGMSSFGLSQELSISRKEATDYIERYFATYPKVKAFLDDSVARAKETGYAITMLGRRRPIPELKSSNFMQRSFGERIAMNAPIQGSAADIMKIAMIRVDQELMDKKMKSRLILQVHDELLIEASKDEVEEVKEILQRQMENAVTMQVPLIAEVHVGKNWFETK